MREGDSRSTPAFETHFAERLNALFERIPRTAGTTRRFSNEAVAEALKEHGITASAGYISHLRTGRKSNPSARLVGGLAEVFGVDVGYFYDGETAARTVDQLDRLVAIRDSGVENILSRTQGLGPDALDHLGSIIEHIRQMQRPDVERSAETSEND